MAGKRRVAPLTPTVRQLIEDATAAGWEVRMIRGRRVLMRPGHLIEIVVVPESSDDNHTWLTPTVATSLYRTLGLVDDGEEG